MMPATMVVPAMVVAVPPATRLGFTRSERAAQQKRYERANDDLHRVNSLFGGAHLLGLHDVLSLGPGLVDNAIGADDRSLGRNRLFIDNRAFLGLYVSHDVV